MNVTKRVREKIRDAAGRRMGPDGIVRSVEQDDEINRWAAATFREEVGKKFLDYLRSITLFNILGPNSDDRELRQLEGMRNLYAIIERRIENGRRLAN